MMQTGKVKKQSKSVFERSNEVATLIGFEFEFNMMVEIEVQRRAHIMV